MDEKDPQPDLPLPLEPAPSATPDSGAIDQLQKQIRELQARLDDHQMRAAQQAAGLWDEQDYLRKLLIAALLVLTLFNLGVLPFFVKQMRMVRNQLPNQRLLAYQMSLNMAKTDPALRTFAAQLQTFAAAYPDFRPFLDKYRPHLAQYFTTVAPAMPTPNPAAPE